MTAIALAASGIVATLAQPIRIAFTGEETHRENSEYAAWYTNMQAIPQMCELRPVGDGFFVGYACTVQAVVTDDYYAAHFGGVAVSSYDTKQNAGKPCQWRQTFSALALLTDPRVQMSDLQYNSLLYEALQYEEFHALASADSAARYAHLLRNPELNIGIGKIEFYHLASAGEMAAKHGRIASHLRYVWEKRVSIMQWMAGRTPMRMVFDGDIYRVEKEGLPRVNPERMKS